MTTKPTQSSTRDEGWHLALPPSGKRRGVLVLHARWGLNDFFKNVAERLATEGFVALAPDLYGGRVATTIEEAKRLRVAPRREPIYKYLIRTIQHLEQHDAVEGTDIGVVGFSMGAHWALWLSQQPALLIAATVAFYGARSGDYRLSKAAFLGHFAETDEWVSPASLKKLEKSLTTAGRPATFYTYPDTGHWFFEADRPDSYQPAAAELAWTRTIDFLHAHLS